MNKFNVALKILLIIFLFNSACFAAEDIYKFSSKEQENQFHSLTSQLRCLVCQNQNIAESNASLAADLRDEVYQQIQRGLNEQEIINYLIARYGDFILYKPPMNKLTLGLWLGPFLFLIIGIGFLIYHIRKKNLS